MKNGLNNPLKPKILRLIGAFFLCFTLTLVTYALFGLAPFGNKSILVDDFIAQYLPYMSYYKNILNSGGSLFYTFNAGGGTEFLSSFAVMLSSPLLFIFTIIFNPINLSALTFYSAIKIALYGTTMFIYLEYKHPKNMWNYLWCVCYCLMAYGFSLNQVLSFFDGFILLPLIILYVEKTFTNQKSTALTILSALVMISNFYIGYIFLLFAGIYTIYYIFLNKIKDWKKPFFIIVRSIILGCFIGAVFFVPSFLSIIQSRASSSANTALPLFQWHEIETIFGYGFGQYNQNDTTSITSIYCGLIAAIMMLSYFFNKEINIRKKIVSATFLLFFLLSFIISPFNIVWHLFTVPYGFPNRFTFCLIFIIITLASDSIALWEDKSKLHYILMGAILMGAMCVAHLLKPSSYNTAVTKINLLVIAVLIVLVYLYSLTKYKLPIFIVILTISAGELCYNSVNFLNHANQIYTYETTNNFYYQYNNKKELLNSIDGNDYRVEDSAPINLNDGLLFNYPSISSYSSSYNGKAFELFYELGFTRKDNHLTYSGETELVNDLFNVKYVIGHNETYMGYTPIAQNSVGTLFENTNALPLAFAIENIGSYQPFTDNPMDNLQYLAKDVLDIDNVVISPYSDFSLELFNAYVYTENNLDYIYPVSPTEEWYLVNDLYIKEDGPLYMYIPNSDIDVFQLWVNDKWQGRIGGNTTSLLYVGTFSKGETIQIKLKPSDSYITYDDLKLFNLDSDKINDAINSIKKQNIDISIKKDTIDISIDALDNQTLFTSIPYDKGWSATINGTKVPLGIYQDSLITLPLEQGNNHIVLSFMPVGFKLGSILSIIAIIIAIYIGIKEKSKKN